MRRLHDSDSRGVERRRTVVTRPDGFKVVRVEKRRRTYDDNSEEKKKANRNKKFLIGICLFMLLLVGGLGGLYMLRLTKFNSQDFAAGFQTELSESWGGKVEVTGLTLDGRVLRATGVKITFPEDSCLSFVSLEGVSGEVSVGSIFMGRIKGDKMSVNRAVVGLRPGYVMFDLPRTGKQLPFEFNSYMANRMEIGYAAESRPFTLDKNNAPFYTSAEAYARTTNAATGEYVFNFYSQKLKIKGWPLMDMDTSKVFIDSTGIKLLSFTGKLNRDGQVARADADTFCSIEGSLRIGADLREASWKLSGRNFELSHLVGTTVSNFLKVRMGEMEVGNHQEMKVAFGLPMEAEQVRPAMNGNSGSVINATMTRLPVFRLLPRITTLDPKEDKMSYESPVFSIGAFMLQSDGREGCVTLKGINLDESGFLNLTGTITTQKYMLSGSLRFSLPYYMIDASKKVDELRREGNNVVLDVKLSGTSNAPADNTSPMLERLRKAAAPPVAERPAGGASVEKFM